MIKLWDQSEYGEGAQWIRAISGDHWQMDENWQDGSSVEGNRILMMEIWNAEIENGLKYIGGFVNIKTTTIDNCFIGFVWRHY